MKLCTVYDPIKKMFSAVEWNENMNAEPMPDETAKEILNAEKERQDYERNQSSTKR